MSKLPELEQRIKERIGQLKNNIHPAHNPIYPETLNIEIETLEWALNEITALRNSLTLKERQQYETVLCGRHINNGNRNVLPTRKK